MFFHINLSVTVLLSNDVLSSLKKFKVPHFFCDSRFLTAHEWLKEELPVHLKV